MHKCIHFALVLNSCSLRTQKHLTFKQLTNLMTELIQLSLRVLNRLIQLIAVAFRLIGQRLSVLRAGRRVAALQVDGLALVVLPLELLEEALVILDLHVLRARYQVLQRHTALAVNQQLIRQVSIRTS